ncbi:hypothetical protein [Noviherbaspirillum pedocola]|uniref:Uncharacterized protein n=1 Tax=Noviherbaspirillum pedocola TaxID=2801341 RepID=A0A934SU20_9BURK|nr:hypothetical protein [Noviherbaspirillum pedocola]MBK4736786.1 hypothetical protein [Noviherbaspirillum pedocola]
MRTIGIRVAPRAVTFVIYNTEENEIVSVDSIKVPKALEVPDSLKFVRNTLLDVIREYGVEKAGVRITESNSRTISHERIQMEGVIQEAFASSPIAAYYCGRIATISKYLGFSSKDFGKYVSGELELDCVEDWKSHNKEEREAILTALGAANA